MWQRFTRQPRWLKVVEISVGALIVLSVLGSLSADDKPDPVAAVPSVDVTVRPTLDATTEAAVVTMAPGTPTPDPHALTVENLTKSYRDNRGYMENASVAGLMITVDGGLARLQIKPPLASETEALRFASETMLVASRAWWAWYPELGALQVVVISTLIDPLGAGRDEQVVMLQINRDIGDQLQYDGLKQRVNDDNKHMLCIANKYQIHQVVWRNIFDKGCLTGQSRL